MFDFSESSMADKNGTPDHLSSIPPMVKQATKRRCSGRLCVTVTFAVVAVLAILVLTAVVVVMFANPQLGEDKNDYSAEIKILKKELALLRGQVNKQENSTIEQHNTIEILQEKVETYSTTHAENIQDLQRKHNDSQIIMQTKLHASQQKLEQVITNATDGLNQIFVEQIKQMYSNVRQQIQQQASNFTENLQTLAQQVNDTSIGCKFLIKNLKTELNATISTTENLQQQIYEVNTAINMTERESKLFTSIKLWC